MSRADNIENLNSDNSVPNELEKQIIENLFIENDGVVKTFNKEIKNLIILGILFIVFTNENTDKLIKKLIPPYQHSEYIYLIIKTILFCFIYFFFFACY